jgi:hypothetical protein
MNGLDLAYEYYVQCGEPMLRKRFQDSFERFAIGLAGEGSECFGFDDEISQDHDFGAGFCIWLTDDDFSEIGADLSDAYESLPTEFMGYPAKTETTNGDRRVGPMRTSDFYRKFTGLDRAPKTIGEWFKLPEHYLAAAVNGRVFFDGAGQFTEIRDELLLGYPEDIRLKKLSNRVATMAQAGQYNFSRSHRRGETVATALALAEFIKAACSAAYLLNKRYMPFYKWAHRGLRDLPILPALYGQLAALVEIPRTERPRTERPWIERSLTEGPSADPTAQKTVFEIEDISRSFAAELTAHGLSDIGDDYLLPHAYSILEHIKNESIRSLPMFAE